VTIGDFATTRVDRTFRLPYLVFNTIMNLTSQDEQVACFANAAAHLGSGTRFLIEVLVPDLQRLPPGETVPVHRQRRAARLRRVRHRQAGLVSHHYRLVEGRLEPSSVPFRRDDAHAGVPGLAHGQQDFVRDHNAITASLRSTRTGPIDEAPGGSIC
jgi:hypothetical protein